MVYVAHSWWRGGIVVHIVVVGSVNVRGTLWLTVVSNLNVLQMRSILAVIRDLNNIAHM
jgi:hypothetical protein